MQQAEFHVPVFVASTQQVLLLSAVAAAQQQDPEKLPLTAVSWSLLQALWGRGAEHNSDPHTPADAHMRGSQAIVHPSPLLEVVTLAVRSGRSVSATRLRWTGRECGWSCRLILLILGPD